MPRGRLGWEKIRNEGRGGTDCFAALAMTGEGGAVKGIPQVRGRRGALTFRVHSGRGTGHARI